MMQKTIWESTHLPHYASLKEDIRTDVLVIGGGMAGILCARLLTDAGVACVLVEAGRLCGGVSGRTTAKLTVQHGLVYHKLLHRFGAEATGAYLGMSLAERAALEQLDILKALCGVKERLIISYALADETGRALREGMTVLGTLVSWALEGSIVTADSMRARGYGTAKRQSFLIYHMDKQDWFLLAAELLLLGGVIASACLGQANAVYIPTLKVASLSWGAVLYGVYVSIPLLINLKEAIVWHISRSRI